MAPEQARDAKRADARADLFSFGAILYELLSGRRAYPQADVPAVLQAVGEGKRRPLGVVAPSLGDLVDWCLELDPAARPQSAREVLERLRLEPEGAFSEDALRAAQVPEEPPAPPAPPDGSSPDLGGSTLPAEGARPVPGGTLDLSGAHPPSALVQHHVPAERDAFVGRSADLERLAELVTGTRLLTVLAMGGTGKTRLVTRYAWTRRDDYPGGVWFCDLTEARTLEGVCHGVARALEVPLQQDAVTQLGHAIAGRGACLLILDNAEQVVEPVREVLGALARPGARGAVRRDVAGGAGASRRDGVVPRPAARGRGTRAVRHAGPAGEAGGRAHRGGRRRGGRARADARRPAPGDRARGCPGAARSLLESAAARLREVRDSRSEAFVLGNLGLLHLEEGRLDEARACLEVARSRARGSGMRAFEGFATGALGRVSLAQGWPTEARASFGEGERLLRAAEERLELGKLLAACVALEVADRRLEAAQAALVEAESIAADAGAGPASELGQAVLAARRLLSPEA